MERMGNKDFLLLPKMGLVKVAKSREVRGKILSATVRRSATGKYFVSILTEQEIETIQTSMFEIGIDVGLKEFATFSDGTAISNPKWFRSLEEKLAKAQASLSRRKLGSSNWHKQQRKVAKIHEDITNARQDFLHKLSSSLVRENQVMAIMICV
ncbi:IS200/IS605 family transposase ISBth17 [Bacillus sp. CECT 9360]|nr:IS200/IS605 family transposase ISBth17 [Bacillus sp. CECT 9360]